MARVLEARRARRATRADLVGRRRRRPGASDTTAVTASPKRSSGTPTTRQSATAGCRFTASSTSSGIDLLAARVDHHRPAAEQHDRAVGLDAGEVARHRPTLAVDRLERRRASSRRPCSSRPGCCPPTASRPTSPEPGTTSSPSSLNTCACGPIENFAVGCSAPGALIEFAKPTPSLDPSESKHKKLPRAMSPCFTSADHITPLLIMSCSDEMSYGSPRRLRPLRAPSASAWRTRRRRSPSA